MVVSGLAVEVHVSKVSSVCLVVQPRADVLEMTQFHMTLAESNTYVKDFTHQNL